MLGWGGAEREWNSKVGRTWRMKINGGYRECRSYKEQSPNKMAKLSFQSKVQG